jgi:hypothetical protein
VNITAAAALPRKVLILGRPRLLPNLCIDHSFELPVGDDG